MASGQTQYYGLSQWEAADKVERVDFNSDNAKIDGALHTLAEGAVWEKIGETRAGIPQMSLSIHVPSIGRYRSLQLIFQASMAKGQDLILLASPGDNSNYITLTESGTVSVTSKQFTLLQTTGEGGGNCDAVSLWARQQRRHLHQQHLPGGEHLSVHPLYGLQPLHSLDLHSPALRSGKRFVHRGCGVPDQTLRSEVRKGTPRMIPGGAERSSLRKIKFQRRR